MTVGDAVRDFIINELHWGGNGQVLTQDYHLIENHVVDSLGLFTLVTFIEEEFGIVVDDEELLPENFGTINAITALVERKRSGVRNPA